MTCSKSVCAEVNVEVFFTFRGAEEPDQELLRLAYSTGIAFSWGCTAKGVLHMEVLTYGETLMTQWCFFCKVILGHGLHRPTDIHSTEFILFREVVWARYLSLHYQQEQTKGSFRFDFGNHGKVMKHFQENEGFHQMAF